ncbi:CPBP family intramembrane glutamic endopeptidase [Hoyosella subflava]|uniref:Abortive infection protein n=1 Tax=Hoyosella subflava (strain DSM 45089 / JCM 17490 / NBRC 109087 / DQS3-9A1) TaxID=443218 RepID=F6EE90_HOYSD|nr:CPBP family intramembrane glutamic endopeptidase [Hoyosella subflava]AEF38542.1 Abortive infection protein [Hoyosella subflava DQS3-9A1]
MSIRTWFRPDLRHLPEPEPDPRQRRLLWIEVGLVVFITLGIQGLFSVLTFAEAWLDPRPIAEQTVALNVTRSDSAIIDFARNALLVVRLLAWAGLAGFLLWRTGAATWLAAQLRLRRADIGAGLVLAAVIGLPGLGLYAIGRTLGITLEVVPSALQDSWWQVPMLVASAIANSAAEEVIVVVYLLIRMRQLGVSPNAALAASALIRGSYHLYQGIGSFGGNIVMGIVFARYFQVSGRVWPLLIAHAVIDIVAFVGYILVVAR